MKLTLKAARVNAGLTQEQAADEIGVSRDVISNWESARTYPNVMNLKQIERVYGVSYNDLIFLTNDNALSGK